MLGFDVGQGNQDLGFRAEVPILFDIRPAIPVKLSIKDANGTPTAARLTFRDKTGHVYPPQAKRLAPDFFFQQQICRHDGGTVLLPPGELTMNYGRGPEYRMLDRKVTIPANGDAAIDIRLERWINATDYGFYSGDHHIHAAGVWAHHRQKARNILEAGDIDEGLRAASAIGDDKIQMESQGYVIPDSFTHGSSEQRRNWFRRGLETGNMSQGDTFKAGAHGSWRAAEPQLNGTRLRGE